MQPSAKSKRAFKPWKATFDRTYKLLSHDEKTRANEQLADLTFLETKTLVGTLDVATSAVDVMAAFRRAFETGTLQKVNDDGTTTMAGAEEKGVTGSDTPGEGLARTAARPNWKTTSEQDRNLIRLPPPQSRAAAAGMSSTATTPAGAASDGGARTSAADLSDGAPEPRRRRRKK